ncbi:MAG TPA: DinB family protein [Herpetosiphonaceae bacterium]
MTTLPDALSVASMPTLPDLIALVDMVGQAQVDLFAQITPRQLDTRERGGWTGREILSHIIGSWQRVPLWASFYLDADSTTPVPIHTHDPFWIREWQTTPVTGFKLSLAAAIGGNHVFLRSLDPDVLGRTHPTPFGVIPLAAFLQINYQFHIGGNHTPQLQSLLVS